jgi:outer membrane protein OmpA-like peptidoglycan-associated protein
MHWNRIRLVALPLAFSGLASCAASQPAPRSLVEAREAVFRAKEGLAMQLDPTDVHEAELALERAEQAWRHSPGEPGTDDLAVIADRKAMIAQSEAVAIKASRDAQEAELQAEAARAAQLQTTEGQLSQTRQTLGVTQMQLQQQQEVSIAQGQKLRALEAKLKDARDAIARIAAVKDDDRGMVITLQGEVLFKTGKWDLKPAAMAKLDQIADALKGKEQPIVVYGFTDNVGTFENNLELSQKRADAVRNAIVAKGIPQDLVVAQGKGPDMPVADNQSVEGRAQNRRVEIVVQPKK